MTTATGEGNYPGNATASDHWPNFGPGDKGVLNSLSPKFFNTSKIVDMDSKPEILRIRGFDDSNFNDASFFDINYLGQLGVIPGWQGEGVAPEQKMVTQPGWYWIPTLKGEDRIQSWPWKTVVTLLILRRPKR